MPEPRRSRLNRRDQKSIEQEVPKPPDVDLSRTDKRSEYIKQKLDDILDNIGKSYGQRMVGELMKRLEKTIREFNEEIVEMLDKLEVLEEERRKELEALNKPAEETPASEEKEEGEEEQTSEEEFAEMSDFERRLERMEQKKQETEAKNKKEPSESGDKSKKRGLFRKKDKQKNKKN